VTDRSKPSHGDRQNHLSAVIDHQPASYVVGRDGRLKQVQLDIDLPFALQPGRACRDQQF
jgi:hypothetical protein